MKRLIAKYYPFFLVLLLAVGCQQKQSVIENTCLQEAVDSLWSRPHYSWERLSGILDESLSETDLHIYHITCAHASLKLYQCLPEETDLPAEAAFFKSVNLPRFAGEAYYVLGAYQNWQGDNSDAMQSLKEAEHLFDEGGGTDILRGMTYYKMGRISETEQLFAVASRYYEKAVPLLSRAGLPLYAACGYRELARTTQDSVVRKEAFAKALHFADELDTLTYLDIRYSALSRLEPNSKELIAISRYLCDSAGQKRYAYDLIRHYLRVGKTDSAKIYLDIFSMDTANLAWSAEKYTYLLSQYQQAVGQESGAYSTLQQLYDAQRGEIEESGMARTFTISEHYDNALVREQNLQLRVEKQHLYVVIGSILIVFLVGIAVFVYVYSRRKARIDSMHAELKARRESMQRMLEQRVSLSKNLQESVIGQKAGALPAWAKDFVETNIFTQAGHWASFREEFDTAYSNLLTRLKEAYPALTPMDLQVIALMVAGLDISDICLLLNLTKRTIWSRRLRIKEHLGLKPGERIEDFLESFMSSEAVLLE